MEQQEPMEGQEKEEQTVSRQAELLSERDKKIASKSARSLAVGAMCACLVVALSLMGYYFPVMGRLVLWAASLPIIIATLECGIPRAVMSLAAAGVILALFLSPLSAISIMVRYGMLGLGFGICFRRKDSGGVVFTKVTLVYMVSYVLGLLLSFSVAGIPVKEGIMEMVATVNSVFDTLENQAYLGTILPPGMGAEEYIAFLKKMTYAILPATFVAYSMLTVWFNYLIDVFILRKLGYHVMPLPPFTRWQMPVALVWLFMVGLVLGIAANYLQMESLTIISGNLLYVLLCLFALAGLSFVCVYLANPQMPMVIKTMTILMLIFFAFFSILALAILGMFDTLFDWRRLHSNATGR